jgi:N-acetylglucosamine kinase-like BadF-type ATPase
MSPVTPAAAPRPQPGLPAVIAVDGGNSKTDMALVAADGTLLASARGPGMDAQRDGVRQTVRILGDLLRKVAPAAGQGLTAPGLPVAAHLSACVANADLPEEEERVCAALRAQGWTLTTSVVNDTFAVLRAGLADGTGPDGHRAERHRAERHRAERHCAERHWGVAVTCGAGINCVGVAPDGRTHRFLALGSKSGDWGGGYGLGRAAVWWAIRAEDGRGPATALRAAVPAHFGVASMHDVAVRMQHGIISEDDVAGLAPVLFGCAAQGDVVAGDLVSRQAEEICLMVMAAMRRLSLAGLATPVVLGGGLLTARDPLLTAGIADRLAAVAPHAVMRIIDVPPVAGAALLGLDEVQAGPDSHARLRSAYPAGEGTGPDGGQPVPPPGRAGGVREVAPGQALA